MENKTQLKKTWAGRFVCNLYPSRHFNVCFNQIEIIKSRSPNRKAALLSPPPWATLYTQILNLRNQENKK
jgi:hypothetical protein